MNNKENDTITYILFSIIIVLILIILGILIFRGKKLDTNLELIKEIYSYTGSNDLEICNGLFVYSDDTINYESLDESTKLCLAYSLLDDENIETLKIDTTKKENNCSINDLSFSTDSNNDKICTLTKVSASKINDIYKKIYNKDINNFIKFDYNNSISCYFKDNNYYCGTKVGDITYSIGNNPKTYRTINKAIKHNDEIIIYDYFIKIVGDSCYKNYTTDTLNNKCTDNYNDKLFNDNKKESTEFLKKYGSKYKHIYKKEGNNYYWVLSSPIN